MSRRLIISVLSGKRSLKSLKMDILVGLVVVLSISLSMSNAFSVKGKPVLTSGEVASALKYYQIENMVERGNECKDWTTACASYSHLCHLQSTKKFCQRTCNSCPFNTSPSALSKCEDSNALCSDAHYYNYCQRESPYWGIMKHLCRRSCGLCQGFEQPECTDELGANYCVYVDKMGVCSNPFYKSFAMKNCRKTCHFCSPVEVCGVRGKAKPSLVGSLVASTTAAKSSWPWHVAILLDGSFHCSGTLVRSNVIITAAHCLNGLDVNRFTFITGAHHLDRRESSKQTFLAEKIIIHHRYRDLATSAKSSFDYDIAIVKLQQEATLNDFTIPACLPVPYTHIPTGTHCTVTGWGSPYAGADHSNVLQQIQIPIAEWSYCQKRNKGLDNKKVTKTMLCGGYDPFVYGSARFEAACHGDSGGPLSCKDPVSGKWIVQGVVSWGSPQCNALNGFTVFTSVSRFLNWIEKHDSN